MTSTFYHLHNLDWFYHGPAPPLKVVENQNQILALTASGDICFLSGKLKIPSLFKFTLNVSEPNGEQDASLLSGIVVGDGNNPPLPLLDVQGPEIIRAYLTLCYSSTSPCGT
ncbi:hypothetical protein Hypma_014454 [Hypsizygus marmoreus]|uniref:Uncharacterized protein n=1 Tax=Hypsizygus marmoreus TaxID=39966 RepID=A0A369J9Y7_HYPMA|nr:hypothetical protein Hypma_014454 [Hypsizygus marmoreus]